MQKHYQMILILMCCIALLGYVKYRGDVLANRIAEIEEQNKKLSSPEEIKKIKEQYQDNFDALGEGNQSGEHIRSVNPLIFEAENDGYININLDDYLGNKNNEYISIDNILPINKPVKYEDGLCSIFLKRKYREGDFGLDFKTIRFNNGFALLGRNSLRLPAGCFSLMTNVSPLRIVVFPHGADDVTKLAYLFAFYTSQSAHGRGYVNLTTNEVYSLLFYDNRVVKGFCGDHAAFFSILLKTVFRDVRIVAMYGTATRQIFPRQISVMEKQRVVGHNVVEVRVNGAWVVVDPMLGLLFFDVKGEQLLSLAEVMRGLPQWDVTLGSAFQIPVYDIASEYLFLTRPLTQDEMDGRNARLSGYDDFRWNWIPMELVSYWKKPGVYHTLPERYRAISDEDFRRYEKYGLTDANGRQEEGGLRKCVFPDLGKN